MAAKKQPSMALENITPTKAKQYLENVAVQRKLRKNKVTEYANDMKAGQWVVSDAAIAFDDEGNLIQGQHRLSACIEANTSFKSWVARDLPASTQDVMDTGARRNLADVLHMQGETNTAHLAAILRAEWNREQDPQLRNRSVAPTHTTLLRKLHDNPEKYREALSIGASVQAGVRAGTKTIWSDVYLILSEVPDADEDVQDFLRLATTGENLGPNHPVYVLRRVLGNIDVVHTSERRKIYALIIKAWNAYRAGEQISNLSFRMGGKIPEQLPVPK